MTRPRRVVDLEAIGSATPEAMRHAVQAAGRKKTEVRAASMAREINHPETLRRHAGQLRKHTLDHLDHYLRQAETQLLRNGVTVHWAESAADASRIVGEICQQAGARTIVKSKSMVSEEIRLNEHLQSLNLYPVETDLGEFIVQIDKDRPSHIVTPIIHKSIKDVARAMERKGICKYTENAEELTAAARQYLRSRFAKADAGITGANFVVAESGLLAIVSNEGNARYCTTAPRIHIAVTGIEKIVAREEELAVFLKLLARSSTGQDLTVYTQFLRGPRRQGEPGGPEQVHVLFLDNGRSAMLGGDYREMLHCIRCGACLNVCPVYRHVTGRAYASVYPGPMGAIFSAFLRQTEEPLATYAHLPKASSLCGACQEVCPVNIPIPEMLLALRRDIQRAKAPTPKGNPSFAFFARLAASPRAWRFAISAARMGRWFGVRQLPSAAIRNWLGTRELPQWPRRSFRSYWKARKQRGKP